MSASKDIQFQAPVEMQLAWAFARKFGAVILPNGSGPNAEKDFELWVKTGCEVKCDYKAKETRNVFLEVFNPYRKKDSGLKATKAQRWIHYIPGDAMAYSYCPIRMLAWLESQTTFQLRVSCGDNNSNGYVVPIKTLAELPFVQSVEVML